MSTPKFRWSKVYESSEEELINFLQSRNLSFERITTEEPAYVSEHTAATALTIWCAEGSLKLQQDGISWSLQPGDAIRVKADQVYTLSAGITGYVCYITA